MQGTEEAVKARKAASRHRAFFAVTAALFAGLLMLALNLLLPAFSGRLLVALFGRDVFRTDWKNELANILLYIVLQLLPGLFLFFALRLQRGKAVNPFAGPLGAPPYPFYFLPMCIGALYALNFVVQLLFGGLLSPFEAAGGDPLPTSLPGFLLYLLQLAVLPPLLEEGLFRGLMLRMLLPAVGKTPAVLVSALVFGLMHLNPAQSIFAFGFGCLAGFAYVQTGSIWFGALQHYANNLISACLSCWTAALPEDSAALFAIGECLLLLLVFGVISACFYPQLLRRKLPKRRATPAERLLPSRGEVARIVFCNPTFYLLAAGYAWLLWLLYFAL